VRSPSRRQSARPGRTPLPRSLKTLSKEEFVKTVGSRLDKGMVSFREQQDYHGQHRQSVCVLEGPSNGDITRAKVEEMKP
jgi:hypothetical protein